ncbi:hypothetical protein HYV85_05745 [Candidatus Woesearchaeota archaeon]|nr:hypothetical protein [Candidatus Woesearchaeota archaeon]
MSTPMQAVKGCIGNIIEASAFITPIFEARSIFGPKGSKPSGQAGNNQYTADYTFIVHTRYGEIGLFFTDNDKTSGQVGFYQIMVGKVPGEQVVHSKALRELDGGTNVEVCGENRSIGEVAEELIAKALELSEQRKPLGLKQILLGAVPVIGPVSRIKREAAYERHSQEYACMSASLAHSLLKIGVDSEFIPQEYVTQQKVNENGKQNA